MQVFKRSPLAILGRLFMAVLFVGTVWMGSAGCIFPDHDHHDDHYDHHDHDHDHDHDWR